MTFHKFTIALVTEFLLGAAFAQEGLLYDEEIARIDEHAYDEMFALEELFPYGTILRDSIELNCCYKREPDHIPYYENEDYWELPDYKPETRTCCYADSVLRRYQVLSSHFRIELKRDHLKSIARCDSINRIKLDSLKKITPPAAPITCSEPKWRYSCFPVSGCREICGHVSYCD